MHIRLSKYLLHSLVEVWHPAPEFGRITIVDLRYIVQTFDAYLTARERAIKQLFYECSSERQDYFMRRKDLNSKVAYKMSDLERVMLAQKLLA